MKHESFCHDFRVEVGVQFVRKKVASEFMVSLFLQCPSPIMSKLAMGLERDGLHGRYLFSLSLNHQILHALNFDKFGGGVS